MSLLFIHHSIFSLMRQAGLIKKMCDNEGEFTEAVKNYSVQDCALKKTLKCSMIHSFCVLLLVQRRTG